MGASATFKTICWNRGENYKEKKSKKENKN